EIVYIFIFFFQAEDGIRCFHVTGVQTCALPIWMWKSLDFGKGCRMLRKSPQKGWTSRCTQGCLGRFPCSLPVAALAKSMRHCVRSEERRVGKDRSDW